MDHRRNSGAFARPDSQYYDYDSPQQDYGPPSGKRQSFSARAGGQYLDPEFDNNQQFEPPPSNNSRRITKQEARRMREPQAALHVPKPRGSKQHSQDYEEDLYQQDYQHGQTHSNSRTTRNNVQPALDIPSSKQRRQDLYNQASPISPDTQSASIDKRRGSVPRRSPLQKLEGKLDDISKEEKRSRLEEAEHRARERSGREHGTRADNSLTGRVDQARRVSADGRQGDVEPNQLSGGRRNVSAPLNGSLDARNRHKGGVDPRGQTYEPQVEESRLPSGSRAVDDSAEKRFRRASEALRRHGNGNGSQNVASRQQQTADARSQNRAVDVEGPNGFTDPRLTGGVADGRVSGKERESADLGRSDSKQYRRRSRDAGFVGAATAAAVGTGITRNGSERRNEHGQAALNQQSAENDMSRSENRRLQRRNAPEAYSSNDRATDQIPESRHQLNSHRIGTAEGLKAANKHQEPDPLPPNAVRNPRGEGPTYQVPPQTAAAQQAREQVGFGNTGQGQPSTGSQQAKHHHGAGGMLHRQHHDQQQHIRFAGPPLDEWRHADTARLGADDLMYAQPSAERREDNTWWERSGRHVGTDTSRRSGSGAYDGAFEEEATSFRPPLYLKCGPLLRYTGMRRERRPSQGRGGVTEREIWRGSVMIVTLDDQSSYERPPTLRLFAQPMQLLPPPPKGPGNDLPPEYVDPLAGQVKVSRTGMPLYVRPIDHLEEGVDLSRVEDDDGLFEQQRSPLYEHSNVDEPSGPQNPRAHATSSSRIHAKDGEKARKFREVKGARLFAERGATFWRFNIEIELGSQQARVAYRINRGPAIGFWVPGRGQTMTMMFHSCNGFSLSVDPDQFSGPDPLWRDVLSVHQIKPYHVMIGGGDQIYNDAAMRDTELFRDWLQMKNPEHKHHAEFTTDMQEELEEFYFERYSMWFSQGLFGMANSQIPMVNIWDDHDIIDGYGSYPHHFMSSKVFTGLGAIAFKYYMLFQHQSVVAETYREEPSWLLGASPGPYINEYSRSIFMSFGRKVAFLGLDCRTERMRDQILSQQTYDMIFNRCRTEIISGETKHLIVLLGVPIAYPRLNFLENVLTSRMMDPIKAIGRTGVLGGFVNKFDGGVEILDDLDDHWTAKHHKAERNWFIQELQELAADKSVRITILGGDVHLGAVGQFYTNKKFGVPKDRDHRYMPNIISSAIVNTPPPPMMGDVLNKRNKIHHLDAETDEDMIPMFDRDVDGKPRNNHHLLPRRNYCSIREYLPGSTPPTTPPPQEDMASPWSQSQSQGRQDERRYPPGSMRRTLSDSFRPGNLVRRLSGSRSRNPPVSLNQGQNQSYDSTEPISRRNSFAGGGRNSQSNDDASYFPPGAVAANNGRPPSANNARPTNMFRRRPTILDGKTAARAAAKGGAEGNLEGHDHDHIDLEGGLDICLNMEVDQHDPAGITVPYRLLVPALFYEGEGDMNTARFKTRRASLMDRFRGRREERNDSAGGESYEGSEVGESRSPSPVGSRGNLPNPSDRRVLGDSAMAAAAGGAAGGAFGARHGQQRNQHIQPSVNNRGTSQRGAGLDGTRDATPRSRYYEKQAPASTQGTGGSFQQAPDEYKPSQATRQFSEGSVQPQGQSRQTQPTRHGSAGAAQTQNAYSHPWTGRQPSGNNRPATSGDQSQQDRMSKSQAFQDGNRYGPPPMGTNAPQRQQPPRGYSEEYEQEPQPKKKGLFSGFMRSNSKRNEGYGRERYGEESETEGSVTETDPESLEPEPQPRQRRQSKADRFFGIGDEKVWGNSGNRQSAGQAPSGAYDDEPYEQDGRRKSGWKIWR